MKKLYFIIPAVLAGIFLFYYLKEKSGIEDKQKAEQAQRAQELAVRKQQEEEHRDRARKEAAIQTEKRAQEREKKRLEDEAQAAALQAAKDARENAFQEQDRMYKLSLRLREDLQIGKDQVVRAREQLKLQQVQVDYLRNSVKDILAKKSIYDQAQATLSKAESIAASNEAARLAAAAAATSKK